MPTCTPNLIPPGVGIFAPAFSCGHHTPASSAFECGLVGSDYLESSKAFSLSLGWHPGSLFVLGIAASCTEQMVSLFLSLQAAITGCESHPRKLPLL